MPKKLHMKMECCMQKRITLNVNLNIYTLPEMTHKKSRLVFMHFSIATESLD